MSLGITDVDNVGPRLERCAQIMADADAAVSRESETNMATLLNLLTVPDAYADWKRALGLYALAATPIYAGVSRWQDETVLAFRKADDLRGWHHYIPAVTAQDATFSTAPRDALGIPALAPTQWQARLARHAPVLQVEMRGDFDRIGAIGFRENEPAVDASEPAAYQRIAFTCFNGQTMIQLVYTFWFSERPRRGARVLLGSTFDFLSGALDGLIVPVTLAPDGEPLLVDSIHACGCYYLFIPGPRLADIPAPSAAMEWAFVPSRLSVLKRGQRIALRIESGTHYVTGSHVVDSIAANATHYRIKDENSLRSVPMPAGGNRSLYGPDGIVAHSARGERFVLWVTGVDSPGAMRQ